MLLTTLLKDLRYGVRLLWNSPGFTAVAVLTMAIGIAANTTVFTWVDAVLFQPRGGIADGRNLVTLECVDPDHEGFNISYPDYLDFRKHLKLSTPAVSLLPQAFRLGEGENWKLVWGELVTDNYFAVLGVKPLLGRLPTAEELGDQPKPVPAQNELMTIGRSRVAPGYFGLMRIPLLAGRDFSKRDILDGKPAIIVNESFARRFYGAQNPVGRRVRIGGDWNEIVGLVRDTKCYRLDEEPRPYFFEPLRRDAVPAGINIYLRTGLDLGQAGALVRREVAAIDPEIYSQTILLSDYIMGPLFPQKIAAVMLTALSIIGLILSAVGLYSMMAYAVGERTHEIGIRVALGAGSPRILAMVIRKALWMAGAGVLAGWVAAYASAHLFAGLLIGVSATAPGVFLGAALFLVLIALLAASLPAYRAARVNPVIALRHE